MSGRKWLTASARELARSIRACEVSSLEVVSAHIAHAQRVNPAVNAIVAERYTAALDEARAVDALLARSGPSEREALAPLLGVPCTIKEAFALTGMPHTSGLVARKGILAAGDAPAVQRLRAAGAIPIGVTNVSELCMWMESANEVYGRTHNAYDSAYTAGGSSGGEGAIVGSGASPFGLGSDVGGSIRMPASFNGVFGHKPTGGLVPGTGQFPIADRKALRYLTTGPIARRAEDLMPLLRILAGPDGQDAGCRPLELGDPEAVSMSGLDVLVIDTNGLVDPSPEVTAALDRAAEHLRSRGARVRRARFAELKHSLQIWGAMLAEGSETTFSQLLAEGGELPLGRELVKLALGRSDHTFPALALATLERLPQFEGERAARWIARGRALREELVQAIGPRGVALMPVYARTVPRHRVAVRQVVHWIYCAILNVLELPSTAIPMGFDRAGLPLGIQAAAIHGHDHLGIAVALELERAFSGWTPPARFFS